MALNPNTLRDAILGISASFPPTEAAAKLAFANAFALYFAEQVAPPWEAGALAAAQAAFVAALDPFDKPHLDDAITAFAVALCLVPPVDWVAIPPPVPMVLPALPPTFDPVTPATAVAAAVDLWARLGTATFLANPPVPWS